ncbi:MAG: RHS repeat-associated core domain-containing protein [Verrucomicrobiota bacterium]
MVREPIDTENGAHVLNHSLLKVNGAQELAFAIDYNSLCLSNDVLGVGWSHNYEVRLQPQSGGSIQLVWNSKRANLFTNQASNTNLFSCSDLPVVYNSLIRNTNGSYTLKEPSQRQFQFDSLGRLQQVVNPHGQSIQLVYQSTTSYPTQIVDSVSGKSLFLNYSSSNLLYQVSDDLGRKVVFAYDPTNHLTRIVKSLGTVFQTNSFSYDSVGRVLSETNQEGICIFTDTYDPQGRVSFQHDALPGQQATYLCYDESQTNRLITTVIDRTGAPNVYIYDQNYLLLSLTDALGNTTSYGYDTNGNQVAITNALGQVQHFSYDSAGNRISSTDALGYTTTSRYDGRNNLTNLVNAASNTASFTFDANNNLLTALDFMTNQVSLSYDTNSLLKQTTSARGGVTTFVHSAGLLTSVTDAAPNTTKMGFDPVGRLISVTNADGFVSTNAYDLNNNLAARSDGLGNTWRYTYDSAGRKLTQADPLGNTNWFYYNGNGDLTNHTDPTGSATLYGYDAEDRMARVTDANRHTRTIIYDAAGRLVSITDALNHTNSFQYDAVGNLIVTVDALRITNQITTYDVRNQPVLAQDALGHQSRMSYDALQRLIQTVDPLIRTNILAYDPLSRLINKIDPLRLLSQQQFDSDGNRTAVINPKSARTSFQYDLANRLLNTTNATSRRTAYAYDGRNLVTKITQPSGALTTLTYDPAGRLTNSQDSVGTIIYGYDNKSRLVTIRENGDNITRQYDALDHLTNYTDSAGNVLRYAYDSVGNLTNLTYPDGNAVAYAYDVANRLTSVKDWNGRTTAYSYDANGRITNIANQNGTVEQRGYDVAGRLIQQATIASVTNIIFQVDYAYDAVGQIIGEIRQPAATAYQPGAVTMTYGADDALTNYAGQTVASDLNGNMTYGPLTNTSFVTYGYDSRSRLTGAGGTTYAYDPAGNRVGLTNSGVAKRFVINPHATLSQMLMRVKNGVTNYYVYGVGLLYEVTPTSGTNKVLTYHCDYRGSTVAITDASGNVTDRVSYSPYGSIVSRSGSTDTPFLFNGKYGVMTDLNGLLYMRARYYDPTTCRFLNTDPIGLAGGMNSYVYAVGNPVSFADPTGLCSGSTSQILNASLAPQISQSIGQHVMDQAWQQLKDALTVELTPVPPLRDFVETLLDFDRDSIIIISQQLMHPPPPSEELQLIIVRQGALNSYSVSSANTITGNGLNARRRQGIPY